MLKIVKLLSVWKKYKRILLHIIILLLLISWVSDDLASMKTCTIKNNGSNLLYHDNIYTAHTRLSVAESMYIGSFYKDYINVSYTPDASDYGMALAYMYDGYFPNCTTKKFVMKCFDKTGKEVEPPNIDFGYGGMMPDNVAITYALFDITNEVGFPYIVGMYIQNRTDTSNYLTITVVLNKLTAKMINIENERQVKNFWKKYANYQIENVDYNENSYDIVEINGENYCHILTSDTWTGDLQQEEFYLL